MPKAHKGKRSRRGYSNTVLFAYHEAGHAVVGHIIGRCIEEVSILSDRKEGYKGYCRFSSWIESANDQNQWLDGNHNPELLTIFYAGMLATAFFCAVNDCYDDYPLRSEQADLEKVNQLLSHISADKKQRSLVKDARWQQSQALLSDNWEAVDALANELLYQGSITGGEAHMIIRRALGETQNDWRLKAWNIEK